MDKVLDIIKQRDCTFPRILLTNYKKLGITDLELIILIYLINSDSLNYNPKQISQDLDIKINDVLQIINNLTEKGIISFEIVKINKLSNEVIKLDLLYEKLTFLIIGKEEEVEEENEFISLFEKEAGRTLTSTEFELINGWQDLDYSEEIIMCALKESLRCTGTANFRYIDRILYEWNKKGIKTKEAVEKNKKEFKKAKSSNMDLFDYDWLNEK